ncbi:mycofactocin-coupled SDR family oxidoreductase [Mycolicibacterium sp. YH-1]|uniref:mycofactocin-coupled SDR family oxidoreductase n=1 Tax=Mycolicibacterium sp. YH-1 TaxID=2908837 RepID=UPI001F4C0331|nr:mycofactocin-coupled SDR family oxidoreductase [Mycolicibacterium sp. YH-1]UNB54524.1 mycofactocin-coupled SDR family oxidoreductase [Mycolicibacterium sp. YH-1]
MGKLDGRVALITGAARGQGRSHAIRLAQEGADIIAVDICKQIDTVAYPMSTPDDLAETVEEVEALDRRIASAIVDVRDHDALCAVVDKAVVELGPVDIILANAGIAPQGAENPDEVKTFRDVVEVNLFGVWNTVHAGVPSMIDNARGGAIVLTSSSQGLSGAGGTGTGAGDGYAASKHGVVGLMRTFANWLAPHSIRVNSIHPTGVNTPMVVNPVLQKYLDDNPALGGALQNLLPVPMIEPIDVSNAVAWLVSDDARYVTGVTLPVDAGFAAK